MEVQQGPTMALIIYEGTIGSSYFQVISLEVTGHLPRRFLSSYWPVDDSPNNPAKVFAFLCKNRKKKVDAWEIATQLRLDVRNVAVILDFLYGTTLGGFVIRRTPAMPPRKVPSLGLCYVLNRSWKIEQRDIACMPKF